MTYLPASYKDTFEEPSWSRTDCEKWLAYKPVAAPCSTGWWFFKHWIHVEFQSGLMKIIYPNLLQGFQEIERLFCFSSSSGCYILIYIYIIFYIICCSFFLGFIPGVQIFKIKFHTSIKKQLSVVWEGWSLQPEGPRTTTRNRPSASHCRWSPRFWCLGVWPRGPGVIWHSHGIDGPLK